MPDTPATGLAALRRVRRLGRGGYGSVFQVVDGAGVARALKVIPVSGDEDAARVARELQACCRVQHPNLIDVLAIEVGEGEARMLMELADGTLDAWLGDTNRIHEVWRYIQQAARGVAALHRDGLVHRDLKPANLLLVQGTCKVADLGLARGQGLRTLTRQGLVMGTPQYMAPEQARGERVGPAADVYAMGLVFLRALRGRPRFSKDLGAMEILTRVARGEPPSMTGVRRRWGSALADGLEKAFDEDPAARPEDVAAWAASLKLPPRGNPGFPRAASSANVSAADREGATTARVPRQSVVRTGPGRTTGPGRQHWKLGRTWGVILGAGLVAGWLVSGRGSSVEPSKASDAPQVPAHPFDEGRLEAMRDELGVAADQRWFRGQRRDAAQAPLSAPRLLAADEPTFWPRIRLLPELQGFYTWMAEGGRPELLDSPTWAALRALDREYQDLGAAPPLWPFLVRDPAPGRLGPLVAAALEVDEGRPLGPWAAIQVDALAQMVAAYREADRRVPEVLPANILVADNLLGKAGAPTRMTDEEVVHALFSRHGPFGKRLASLRVHRVIPGHRAAFRELLAEAERASELLLYAGLRSYAAEPDTRDLALRLLIGLRNFRILPMGRWVSVPAREIQAWGGLAGDPVTYAALRVAFRRARRKYQVGHDHREDLRAVMAALNRIPPGPDHKAGTDLVHAGLVMMLYDLLPPRTDELGRARHLRGFWPHVAVAQGDTGARLRRMLAVLAFEGVGARGVDEEVLRRLRKEIADHPLPGETWYERARDAVLKRRGLAP